MKLRLICMNLTSFGILFCISTSKSIVSFDIFLIHSVKYAANRNDFDTISSKSGKKFGSFCIKRAFKQIFINKFIDLGSID